MLCSRSLRQLLTACPGIFEDALLTVGWLDVSSE
jgi:hypothetical protein